MSVESGGIGGVGAAVSVGPSLNARFGPSISGPESISRLSSSIVNEGPAGHFGLEKTMSIATFKPAGEIKFNNSIAGNVSVEPVKNKPLPDPAVIGEAVYWFVDREPKIVKNAQVLAPITVVSSTVEPATKTEPKIESKISYVLQEQEIEEIIEEKVTEEKTNMIEEEEIVKEERLYVVDEQPLAQRIHEVRRAIKKAKVEAKKLGLGEKVIGSLVAEFMPDEHAGNRSSIVQPNGPDGSYEDTKETIKTGQFNFEFQVEAVVLDNTPVKIGKDGKPVKHEAVWKVLKRWLIKHVPAQEVVISRVAKKKTQVFQKAA